MMKTLEDLVKLLLLAVLLAPTWAGAEEPADFLVVVHADNPTAAMTRSEVSKIFTKRIVSWEDGRQIRPVDQSSKSPVRAAFSEAIHRKSVTAINSYWQRMLFSGRDVPPAEKPSDQAVLDLVRGERDAIGYVSGSATLGAGVKVLGISDLPGYRE